jgi:hypothetical protein
MSISSDGLKEIVNSGDIGKIPISIFYPPPKSNGILDIIANPFNKDTFFMLVETGEICKYRL